MITFKKCQEIFSNSCIFCEIVKPSDKSDYFRVDMKRISPDGYHYRFGFRKMPNGFNDVAEIYFAKWTKMEIRVLCSRISDENFLLELINACHFDGLF